MRLWPRSIRLIHWGLALAIFLDAFFLEDAPHRLTGYAAVAFVFGRLLLKFILKDKIPKARNPLALTVYLLMWFAVIALGVTGWLLGTDEYFGDENLETIHSWLNDGLLFLVLLHFIGIIKDAIYYRRKTWMGMISGRST